MTTTPGAVRRIRKELMPGGKGPTQLLIDGAWVPARSGKSFDCLDPSTGEVLTRIAAGDGTDIEVAVRAARRAFDGPWSRFTPVQRQNVLLKLANLVEAALPDFRYLETIDMGVPISRPDGASNTVENLRYFAGWATKIHGETVSNSSLSSRFSFTLKEPIGVVGSIVAWNDPLSMAIMKLAPVLTTGCTIVLKPAEQASLAALKLGELVQQLDLPPGVVNIVTGFGHTAGKALTEHPDVDKVAFTGSSAVGQQVIRAAAGNLKRVSLELGGKSPNIVFADADLDAAAIGAGIGVFANSGQICCAGTRIFVQKPVYEEFVARLSAFGESMRVGDGLDPDTQIGPLVSEVQLDRVLGYVDSGRSQGGRVVSGGDRVTTDGLGSGYFVPPTVFADVVDEMTIAREEIFGPVASVLPFDDVDDVVTRANASEFGLSGGVWTKDIARAHRVAQALRTGMVWVNSIYDVDPAMPFGGVRKSGWGNEYSGHSLDEYLNVKAVWINTDLGGAR